MQIAAQTIEEALASLPETVTGVAGCGCPTAGPSGSSPARKLEGWAPFRAAAPPPRAVLNPGETTRRPREDVTRGDDRDLRPHRRRRPPRPRADLDDLFRTAAEGLFDYVVANRAEVRADDIEKVSLRDDSTADLLASWLSELIFRSETHHRVFRDFEVQVADDGLGLEATITASRSTATGTSSTTRSRP